MHSLISATAGTRTRRLRGGLTVARVVGGLIARSGALSSTRQEEGVKCGGQFSKSSR